MPALQMIITDAGLEAIVNAQEGGTEAILITEIGLSGVPFVMAPTLTALPGEFRRIDTVSGQAIAENVIHVVAYDPAPITYDVTGFGLYDGDGTLIAVHSAAAAPILSKAELATSLFAMDIMLSADIAAVIEFGDALFLNPPATEETEGVVKLSTNAMVDAAQVVAEEELDDATAMTPAKVKRMIAAAVAAALDAADEQIIKIWSGSIEDIKPGWQLCDGTNGTPDLRDKFVIGAGNALAPGAVGGAETHDHGAATAGHVLTEAQMPPHRHQNVVAAQGDNPLTAATSLSQERTLGGDTQYILNSTPGEPTIGRTSSVGGGTAHAHGIGASGHLPPYYALAFIMKA